MNKWLYRYCYKKLSIESKVFSLLFATLVLHLYTVYRLSVYMTPLKKCLRRIDSILNQIFFIYLYVLLDCERSITNLPIMFPNNFVASSTALADDYSYSAYYAAYDTEEGDVTQPPVRCGGWVPESEVDAWIRVS